MKTSDWRCWRPGTWRVAVARKKQCRGKGREVWVILLATFLVTSNLRPAPALDIVVYYDLAAATGVAGAASPPRTSRATRIMSQPFRDAGRHVMHGRPARGPRTHQTQYSSTRTTSRSP